MPPPWRTASLRIAGACWLVPLVVGVAIFAASEVVRATAPAGVPMVPYHGGPPAYRPFTLLSDGDLLTILGGTVAAVLGMAAIATFVATRWSAAPAAGRRRQVIAPATIITVLLASNFGIALLLASLAIR